MKRDESFYEKVKEVLEELKPRLDELADGYAELIDADEKEKRVRIKLIGGKLH
jgi:DNA replication initiation complex subunit (GINS family)